MGLTRKLLSVGTVGAVDFRSDKERTAAYTKGARKEARKQTEIMEKQAKAAKRAEADAELAALRQHAAEAKAAKAAKAAAVEAPVAPTPAAPPAGFYHDPEGQQVLRWWDGVKWTDMTQPLS